MRHAFALFAGLIPGPLELHMRQSLHKLTIVLAYASVIAMFAWASPVHAQQKGHPVPYASIGSNGVSYEGPGREASFDLSGPTIHIGILAPVHGPQKPDGEAIVRAAQMALRDASRRPFPRGLHFALDVADESVPPWGLLGDEIIHLVVQQNVVAIVTGANGVAAHLSEQIGNKIGVPTLTLSTDPTTTQINMPWVFRLGPSDTQQAQVIARDVYQTRGFQHVLLVTGNDHDGRMGGREFVEAARQLGVAAPDSLAINPLKPDAGSLLALVRTRRPQAIVFWTQPEIAQKLIQATRAGGVHTPIYLSQESAQESSGLKFHRKKAAGVKDPLDAGIYTVASALAATPSRESFASRYQAATGAFPSPVATEAYDAVRLIARAVREAGPNRARVRDHISSTQNLAGVSGTISFDSQGNNRADVCLVRLQ